MEGQPALAVDLLAQQIPPQVAPVVFHGRHVAALLRVPGVLEYQEARGLGPLDGGRGPVDRRVQFIDRDVQREVHGDGAGLGRAEVEVVEGPLDLLELAGLGHEPDGPVRVAHPARCVHVHGRVAAGLGLLDADDVLLNGDELSDGLVGTLHREDVRVPVLPPVAIALQDVETLSLEAVDLAISLGGTGRNDRVGELRDALAGGDGAQGASDAGTDAGRVPSAVEALLREGHLDRLIGRVGLRAREPEPHAALRPVRDQPPSRGVQRGARERHRQPGLLQRLLGVVPQ